jgi:DNA-binding NarL/FixJ family response regulator
MKTVRLIAGEFEDLVSMGLRAVIAEDATLELLADRIEFSGLSAAIDEQGPDVVLLNFGALPSPISVHELHERHPHTRLVVLASRPTPAECNQLLSLGATGCVAKDTEARDIINAIHLAARGMHVMPRDAKPGTGGAGPDVLTAREAGVLELLQAGMTNGQIAQELSIGIETVRTHARSVYRKLGVSSRRELARMTAVTPRAPTAAGRGR